MNASPLPLAEVAPPVPGVGPARSAPAQQAADLPVAADQSGAGAPRGTADFAALLLSAGLAAEPSVADELPDIAREGAPDAVPGSRPESPPHQLLLLMSSVPSQGVAALMTTSNAVTPPAPEAATPPVALPGAERTAHRGRGSATTAGVSLAIDPPNSPDPDVLAPVAAFAAPSPEAIEPLARQAATNDVDPAAFAPRARPGARTDAKFDPAAALILASSVAPGARPAQETVGRESKSLVTVSTSPPDATLSPPSTTTAASRAPLAVEVAAPVHDPAWRGEVAGRIASLITRGVEHAELRLSPAELGPVELRIDVRGGEATLAIFAVQPTTRDALEQALPLLRDMLAQQGLSLGQASVQDGRADNPANGNGSAAARTATFTATPADSSDAQAAGTSHPGLVRRLVDVFA